MAESDAQRDKHGNRSQLSFTKMIPIKLDCGVFLPNKAMDNDICNTIHILVWSQ